MSISSEITSIGENLKKDYQSIANLGADLTGVDKNIENISSLLDGVYDVLPKTSFQEGTEVTIEGGLKGKLDFENGVVGIGNTEQDSTQGYQLFNIKDGTTENNGITAVTKDGEITLTGTATNNAFLSIYIDTGLNYINGQTYTMTANNSVANSNIRLRINSTGAFDEILNNINEVETFTYNNEASMLVSQINIRVQSGTAITTPFKLKPMLEKGSTAHDWEKYTGGQASPNPSYPQQIKSVTGNQDVVVSGKNLFEPVISVDGTQIVGSNMSNLGVTDGEFSFTANGTDVYFGQVLASGSTYMANRGIKIYRNGNEKISYKISNPEINRNFITAYDNNGTSLGYVEKSGSAQGTYTFPTNCDFVTFRIGKGDAVSGTTYKFKVIVAYGDEIPDYEPYKTPKTYQLSLGDHKFYGIGNYKDELVYDVDEDKVYKNSYIKEIGKDDVLQRLSSGYMEFTDVVRSVINLGDLPSSISSANGLCSHLVFLADFTRNIEHFYVQGTQIFFFIKKSRLSEISITGIYNYLATLTDLKFCYVMNTPTLTEITDTTLKAQVKAWYYGQSLDGTTIIEGNGDLPMIIKCRALKGE